MRRHFILSDIQIPYHDSAMLGEFIYRVRFSNPTSLTVIGDFIDLPMISRWNKDTIKEYTESLHEHTKEAKAVLRNLSSAVDCPLYFHIGNHEERLSYYVKKYAPGLASLPSMKLENMLDFKGNRVAIAGDYHLIDSAFVTTHGHLGRLARQSGQTALGVAKRINMNVVCGHSHRLGIAWESSGVAELGTRRTVWGMEVGHMMDIATVGYQRDKVLNWQSGYGLVSVDQDGMAHPSAIEI